MYGFGCSLGSGGYHGGPRPFRRRPRPDRRAAVRHPDRGRSPVDSSAHLSRQPHRVGRQVVYRHAVHSVADRSNGYPPSTFVLHPNDWEAIELALLSTSAVEFQGLPFDAQRRTLWSVAFTVTNAQTASVAHTLVPGVVGLNTDSQVCRSLGRKRLTPTIGQRT